MPYTLINKLTAKPGQRDRVAQLLIESGNLFDDNADVFSVISESARKPTCWVTDLWPAVRNTRPRKQPELRPFLEQALPLLEGMPEQIEIRPIGGKGLPQ
jgi:hypothetical protein